MQSEGPYKHLLNYLPIDGVVRCALVCPACAYAEGRKAEREITARLLMYARHRDSCGDMDAHNHDKFPSCNCGLDELKDAIRGGNDAK
jgi:hypothetical protein